MRTFKLHTRLGIVIGYTLILLLRQALHSDPTFTTGTDKHFLIGSTEYDNHNLKLYKK